MRSIADHVVSGGAGKPRVELGNLVQADYDAIEAARKCLEGA